MLTPLADLRSVAPIIGKLICTNLKEAEDRRVRTILLHDSWNKGANLRGDLKGSVDIRRKEKSRPPIYSNTNPEARMRESGFPVSTFGPDRGRAQPAKQKRT
jgi:hypothetical protein